MSKPTVVIVPGSFASINLYRSFSQAVQSAGYPTVLAPLKSSDPSDPSVTTAEADSLAIRDDVLIPLLNEGKSVVLFAHSYGGIAGGGAATGLSKAARKAQGLEGGLLGIIYLVPNLVHAGISLLHAVGGEWPPHIALNTPREGLCVLQPAAKYLFNDMPAGSTADLEALVTPHSMTAFTTPVPPPVWKEAMKGGPLEGRVVYIRTLKDTIFPPEIQDQILATTEVEWHVANVDASHGACCSQADTVVGLVHKFAQSWVLEDAGPGTQ